MRGIDLAQKGDLRVRPDHREHRHLAPPHLYHHRLAYTTLQKIALAQQKLPPI